MLPLKIHLLNQNANKNAVQSAKVLKQKTISSTFHVTQTMLAICGFVLHVKIETLRRKRHSARVRSKENVVAMEKEKSDSTLYKHRISEYNNEDVKFKFEITRKFKDALSR